MLAGHVVHALCSCDSNLCVCVCVCVGVSRAAFIHRGGGEGLGKSLKVLSVAAAFEGVLWGCGVGRLHPSPPHPLPQAISLYILQCFELAM